MKNLFRVFLVFIFAMLSVACGSSIGTGVGNPPSTVGQAIAAIFSPESSEAISKALITFSHSGCVGTASSCLCEEVATGDAGRVEVDESLFADVGVYGSEANPVTVPATDFCTLADGTSNAAGGADGLGLFAGFEIITDIVASCDNGDSVSLQIGSVGVTRNIDLGGTDYQSRIYGTFNLGYNGVTYVLDCTLIVNSDQTIATASCSDANGNTVEQSTSGSCQVL